MQDVIAVAQPCPLQAGHVGVEGLDGLGVVQRAVHPTAPGRAHHHRHGEVAVGAVVDASRLRHQLVEPRVDEVGELDLDDGAEVRSEEHTSELQSLMRISYAVFCLKKKNKELTQYHSTVTIAS